MINRSVFSLYFELRPGSRMDHKTEDRDKDVYITPDELQMILDRASAEDVPTLVTALRNTYKVLQANDKAVELYQLLYEKVEDANKTRDELMEALHDSEYAVWEAVHFLREFRKQEVNTQTAHLPNTESK